MAEMKKKIDGTEAEFAVIELSYTKGGMNYMSGNVERRGLYLFFTKMEIKDHCRTFMPMNKSNYKIFIKEMKRKSQKQENHAWELLYENKEELFAAYLADDKSKIFEILRELGFEV